MFIFKIKRKLLNEQAKVKNRDMLIENLTKQNSILKQENSNLKDKLMEEQIKNHSQRRKLLNINKLLNIPYGNYKSLLEFRKSIQKELAETGIKN